MKKQPDRRIRRTRALLRHGLAQLMQTKSVNEATVKELVELVDINRSTFYLHYTDIYNLLESIENELFEELEQTIHSHPVSPFNQNSLEQIEGIFRILFENREICNALLGPNGDIGFLHRIESMISDHCLNTLRQLYPEQISNITYIYSFCMAGCVGLIKKWLAGGCVESAPKMAQLTFRLIMNTVSDLHPHDLELK